MNKESTAMSHPTLPRRRSVVPGSRPTSERGQMLVIFALALIALIGMVGLIIDGGDTFLQRRDEQNAADAAAMAAGYAWVNTNDQAAARAAAQSVAAANGYTDGVGGTTVTVTFGTTITVDVTKPHRNYFSGVVGMASWDVSTTASVQAGIPNAAYGAMPIIFNKKAFDIAANKDPLSPAAFSEPPTGVASVPQDGTTFNWTVFGTANGNDDNLNTQLADQYINDNGNTTTVKITDGISPLNAGSHTQLYSDLAAKVGGSYAVGVVDDSGALLGWAWFHVTGSVGGSTKQISGWLDPAYNVENMVITAGGGNPSAFGGYVVKLTN